MARKKELPSVSGDLKKLEEVLNKEFGDGDPVSLVDNIPVFSTGLSLLDIIIGGGLRLGSFVHIWGDSGNGKTVLALHLVSAFQRQYEDGLVIFIDSEHALPRDLGRKMGINFSKVAVVTPTTMEKCFDLMLRVIDKYPDKPKLIVWDSLAAAVPKEFMESDVNEKDRLGIIARVTSKAIPKVRNAAMSAHICIVTLNQVRTKIGVMFGNPDTAPGGKAAKFYSDLSIRLRVKDKILSTRGKDVIGLHVQAEVDKSRWCPPYRKACFTIWFHGEVNDHEDFLEVLKTYDLAVYRKGKGYILPNGTTVPSKEEFGRRIKEDDDLRQYCCEIIRKAMFEPDDTIVVGADEVSDDEPSTAEEIAELLEEVSDA